MGKNIACKFAIGILSLGIVGMSAVASVDIYSAEADMVAVEQQENVHEQKILARTIGEETDEWSVELDTAESRLP